MPDLQFLENFCNCKIISLWLPDDYEDQVYAVKAGLRKSRSRREEARAEEVHAGLPVELKRAAAAAAEKGGSAVFTVLPLERHGFAFRAKRDFLTTCACAIACILGACPRRVHVGSNTP